MAMIEIETLEGDGSFAAYARRARRARRAARSSSSRRFSASTRASAASATIGPSLGYVALAPDLFWRLEPGVELDPDVPEQFQQALGLMQKLDQDQGIADIEATIREARAGWPAAARSAASAIASAAGSPS